MNLTIKELGEKLAAVYDEVSLLEILGINAHDIVARFPDLIEQKYDELIAEFEEEDEDTDWN